MLAACVGLNLVAALVFGTLVSRWHSEELVEQTDHRLRDAAVLAGD